MEATHIAAIVGFVIVWRSLRVPALWAFKAWTNR